MKPFHLFLLGLSLLLIATSFPDNARAVRSTPAKCYGYSPCNACKNCSACQYCNAGGSCGVCSKGKSAPKTEPAPKAPASSGQCKATTKKGTRCSRNGPNGGYCYQHD